MRWGLVPSWAKSDTVGTHPINARSESLETKPMFSRLVGSKRCVVIADGYFEWEKRPDGKQPYFHRFFQPIDSQQSEHVSSEMKQSDYKIKQEPSIYQTTKKEDFYSISKPITLAGLYDVWVNASTGEELYTYTIITVPASKEVQWIHDRMPAILDYEEIDTWLQSQSHKDALALLKPYPKPLDVYPVSRVVNNIRNQTPECVLPLRPSTVAEKKSFLSDTREVKTCQTNDVSTLDSFIKTEKNPIQNKNNTKDIVVKEEDSLLSQKRKQPEGITTVQEQQPTKQHRTQ